MSDDVMMSDDDRPCSIVFEQYFLCFNNTHINILLCILFYIYVRVIMETDFELLINKDSTKLISFLF